MADATACAFADRVAGAVLVSAVQFGNPCAPARPVPIVALHAIDDGVLPYAGGHIASTPAWFPEQQPVEDAVGRWAVRNGCVGRPVTADLPYGGAVLSWAGCDAPVTLHRLARGGHDYAPLASQLLRDMIAGSGPSPDGEAAPTIRCPDASPTYAGRPGYM